IHIDSTGILNVTNSIISGNSAAGGGGGISNYRGAVNVTGSTISNNDGDGILNDPQANGVSATLTVTNSTISGNPSSTGQGGAILNRFSSIATSTITVTVTNSTTSGNIARGFCAPTEAPGGS